MTRRNISSGHPYEAVFGYSRAVRVGDQVHVAGTTAVGPDAYTQARGALRIVIEALKKAGAAPADVVRTVVYVTDMAMAGQVARAHAEIFGAIRPASTMVAVSALLDPQLVVEVEAYAVLSRDAE